jgi:hypothetical protein
MTKASINHVCTTFEAWQVLVVGRIDDREVDTGNEGQMPSNGESYKPVYFVGHIALGMSPQNSVAATENKRCCSEASAFSSKNPSVCSGTRVVVSGANLSSGSLDPCDRKPVASC